MSDRGTFLELVGSTGRRRQRREVTRSAAPERRGERAEQTPHTKRRAGHTVARSPAPGCDFKEDSHTSARYVLPTNAE